MEKEASTGKTNVQVLSVNLGFFFGNLNIHDKDSLNLKIQITFLYSSTSLFQLKQEVLQMVCSG